MPKKKKNERIKCNVESCDHNNKKDNCCELDEIEVSCTCKNDECCDCDETICSSFENKGGPITDTEYEVQSEIDEDEDMTEEDE